MIISYSDGRQFEAALLTRTETTIRVAIQGDDDVTEFSNLSGVWVSPDCEAVTIEFAPKHCTAHNVSESDCICSHEKAAVLLRLLFSGSPDDNAAEIGAPEGSNNARGFAHLPV
jgi:hypothetical protein